MFLIDLDAQRQQNFSLGRHAAALAPLNPIDGERRDSCHSRQLRLAQHLSLTNLLDVVPMIHAPTSHHASGIHKIAII